MLLIWRGYASFYAPGALLTPGLTNAALYLDPNNDIIDLQTNLHREFDPMEVMARLSVIHETRKRIQSLVSIFIIQDWRTM